MYTSIYNCHQLFCGHHCLKVTWEAKLQENLRRLTNFLWEISQCLWLCPAWKFTLPLLSNHRTLTGSVKEKYTLPWDVPDWKNFF